MGTSSSFFQETNNTPAVPSVAGPTTPPGAAASSFFQETNNVPTALQSEAAILAAANAAAASASSSLAAFHALYLGPFAVEPSTTGVTTGALYYNTATAIMRVFNGTAWVDFDGRSVATNTWAATVAIDWATGNIQRVTLAGATTFTFANGRDGGRLVLELTQDATGSRTVTLPASVHYGALIPSVTFSTAANKKDRLGFIYNSATASYDLVAIATGF